MGQSSDNRPAAQSLQGEHVVLAEIARIATEDLELSPMLQRITDALAARFGWELVALVRLDLDERRFVCEAVTSSVPTVVTPGYSRPFGSGVVGEVVESGQVVLIDDTATYPGFIETGQAIRSELCAPIRHRGAVVAVLNLESPRLGAFTGQLPLVEAIVGQIAGAIASASLYRATRQRALNFEVLSEVSRAAVSGGDLKTVLQSVASYLQRRFDLLLAAILVPDMAGRRWSFRAFATREPLEQAPGRRWPVQPGVVGRAARLKKPQLVLDVAADPDYFAVLPQVKAELVVPILIGEQLLGILNLENDDPRVFSSDNQGLLELVADQVAGAIQMALLNERLAATRRQLVSANRSLERLSRFDPLTGLANRRRLDEVLRLECRRSSRAKHPLSLLLLDVDHFKALNDALGHPAGDRCLQQIARVLEAGVRRAGDLVARYGGEEFAAVLVSADLAGAQRVAALLQARLEELALPHPATGANVTVSIGIATTEAGAPISSQALLAAADRALYRAKQNGRNRIETEP